MSKVTAISRRTLAAAYFTSACDYPSFYVPIIAFYGTQYLHLSITTTIVIFYGVGGLSNFCEVPAGAFADKYGRRLSYSLGITAMSIGMGIWLFHVPLALLIIGRLIYCVGDALSSGTVDAMVYEEHRRENAVAHYLAYKSKARSGFYIARVIAMPIGAILFSISPPYAIVASIVSTATCGFVALLIPDNNVVAEEHTTRTLMASTFKRAIQVPFLRILLVATFFLAFISESFWRLFQPFISYVGFDVKNIGWFYALFSVISFISTRSTSKISRHYLVYISIASAFIGVSLSILTASIFPFLVIVIVTQCFNSTLFGIIEVPVPSFLQHHFQSHQQTTLLSVYSMTMWGGATLGAIYGAVFLAFMDVTTVYFVLAGTAGVTAVILSPVLYRHAKHEVEPLNLNGVHDIQSPDKDLQD